MKLYNKNGSLSLYGFSCGYIESIFNNSQRVELYLEHRMFHLRYFDRNKQTNNVWESFEINELTKARKEFKKLISEKIPKKYRYNNY